MANANTVRDWRIYADFAQTLIRTARSLYRDEPFGVDLDHTVYALDATTIDLCLSLFPWTLFRRRKAAIKLHTLLDLRGNIPAFIRIRDETMHDVNVLDELITEPGAFYILDRAYIDFYRLHDVHINQAFFGKENKRSLVFLTNNFSLPALTITELYKCRWQVELFFKWIKQHLRIKKFFGNSENAVKTQVWIAVSVYVLSAIMSEGSG